MEPDDEREVEETRAFFRERGLLPPIPERYDPDDEDAERLLRQILARGKPRPGTGRRRALLAAAAVAVVATAGGAYALLHGTPATAAETPAMLVYSAAGPESVGSAPPATDALAAAARSAATAPDPGGTGAVQYVATYGWSSNVQMDATGPVQVAIYPTLTQWWLAPDGAVRADEHRGAPLGLDGRLAVDVGRAPDPVTSETSPAGTIDADLARRLSTDPATLRAELLDTQAGLPCDQDARWQAECLVRAVQMIDDQYVVSPSLASAMWSVLADEDPLRSLGTTVDRLGRPASAVALPLELGQPSEAVLVLLLSESTGAYLGAETVTLRSSILGIDEPTVTDFSVLSTAQWVEAPGDSAPAM